MVAHCFHAPLRLSVSLRHRGMCPRSLRRPTSLSVPLPPPRQPSPEPSLAARLSRSLLCIIKTLEQIFILFAIQLDRQFPGRLRKYLFFFGTGLGLNFTTLGHFPHYRLSTVRENTYPRGNYAPGVSSPLFILPIDAASLSSIPISTLRGNRD